MQSTHKLPVSFDPIRLKEDLARVPPEEWLPHFSKIQYDAGWSGVALRSSGGNPVTLEAGRSDYGDTKLLCLCPYFREVLSQFKCPLRRVRLLKLESGARIKEHIDPRSDKVVRLHIPIVTNPDVEFCSNGSSVVMAPGELWFIDVTFPHSVSNRGDSGRIHLVIDCVVNDWLRALFPSHFFVASWPRVFAYKMRVVRFMGRDAWTSLRSRDFQEFRKRARWLIWELSYVRELSVARRTLANRRKHEAQ